MTDFPKVVTFDYAALVEHMSNAGFEAMGDLISEAVQSLGKPETKNEALYFWLALFNAARVYEDVWLWLCAQPYIRFYAPNYAQYHTIASLAPTLDLPEIGGPDDEPMVPLEFPKQWPAQTTPDNLKEQAEALDVKLREEAQKHPNNLCKNVDEYVATFYYSGSARMHAKMQLIEAGFLALATEEGIRYLRETYPPR